jgi:hypothetical protein
MRHLRHEADETIETTSFGIIAVIVLLLARERADEREAR